MYHSRKKGFTMVELVIVIAVIAILAAILIPTFTNLIRKANEASALADARNAANQLLANLLARGDDAKDLVIFNQKGDDIYVYGYSAEAGRVLTYYGNPVDAKSIDGETLEDKADKLLEKMLANGELTYYIPRPVETDWWHPSKMEEVVTGLNFKPEEMVLRADYKIVLARFEKGGQPEHTCTAADLDEIAEVPATCSTNGYPAYWVCRVCGKAYHDADATEPVSAENPLVAIPIDLNAHQLGAWQHDESKHWQNCTLNPGHTHLNEAAHTGNPCTVCGYSTGGNTPTSPAGKKNGLVDGYYYKDDELFTGTENGYTFEDGILVLTGVVGEASDSNSSIDQKLTFTVPEDTKYLTKKIKLKFEDSNSYLQPSWYGGYEMVVRNNTQIDYSTVSIKSGFDKDIKAAISELRDAVRSGNTDGIFAELERKYGFTKDYYPTAVSSDDFKAYLQTLGISGINSDDDYGKYTSATNSYVEFLKEKYNVSYLSEMNWDDIVNYASLGSWPASNTSAKHGIFDGERYDTKYKILDPEYILLFWEHTYNKVFFTGLSNSDPSALINAAGRPAPTNRFYKYGGADWKEKVGAEFGTSLYSPFECSNGQFIDLSTDRFFIFTASHGFLMSNSWQDTAFAVQDFTILLERIN